MEYHNTAKHDTTSLHTRENAFTKIFLNHGIFESYKSKAIYLKKEYMEK